MKIFRPPCVAALLVMSTGALICSAASPGIVLAAQQATAAAGPALNPSHPDSYVVKRGDTLWDISGMFLKDPWYWPEIWYANPQVENPHLIYPGDVLTLVYVDGKPRVQVERGTAAAGGTEKLSPRVRESALASAIPAIPLEVISAFLGHGSILQKDEYEKLPYLVALEDQQLRGAAGNDVYVRGKVTGVGDGYSVVHVGDKLRDPDNGDVLGYEGIYVGAGTMRRLGDPSTLFLNDTSREAGPGDRLIAKDVPLPGDFTPTVPSKPVKGTIVAVVDGVSQIGQYQVVVINRGTRHGLAVGNVLRVWQTGEKVPDTVASEFLPGKVKLPDEPAGVSMVFRTYDRVSYALIMEATSEIHVLDTVTNPT